MTDEHAGAPAAPMLRVVSGSPTAEELAVLVAVVSAAGSAASAPEPARFARWSSRAALVRHALPTGHGAWRASGLPR